jgi:predicted DNA-binding protein
MYYGGDYMISLRLTKEMEEKLEYLSKEEQTTKSDLIREAIEKYIVEHENIRKPYELGQDLFGKKGSGKVDLSLTYKQKVKEKICEKMSD